LDHAGKYRTKDKLKIQTTQKLNTNQKYETTQTLQRTSHGSVAFYQTRPGNEVIFYRLQCSRVHTGYTAQSLTVNWQSCSNGIKLMELNAYSD